jgi:pimeloyl-ACP methyl ester carboxylesterase
MKWMPIVLPIALMASAVVAAMIFGGPAPIKPLASINEPFAKVDFSAVPPAGRFTARDGAQLAWLHYPANNPNASARRVVLVHGSSARGQSMHPMAQALAAAGYDVAALDIRGHGDSGPRGHIAYIGQLEDDLEDFMKAQAWPGPTTLLGFSSGGGFVLRVASGDRASLFDRYLLLSPFLHQSAPTGRPGNDGWVSIGLPRIVALTLLNTLGITRWNHLPTLRFGLNEVGRQLLTGQYDFNLATNFRPRSDYKKDIQNIQRPLRIVAGTDDELFDASRFGSTFAEAGHAVPVTLVPGVNHMGLTLDPRALAEVVKAVNLE